jgi:hypothetical protein
MDVRHAVDTDAIRVASLIQRFHASGDFRFKFNVAKTHQFVLQCIAADDALCIVIDAPVSGLLIARQADSVFGDLCYAQEIVIWVEPDARGHAWRDLRTAYEAWAKQRGCQKISLSRQEHIRPKAMDRLFRAAGYAPGEVVYFKDI